VRFNSISIKRELFWLIAAIFLFAPTLLEAQQISVQAAVESQEIVLGSSVKFTITINGTQKVSALKLPDIDGFDVRYSGPSRQVSIVNGQYSSSITFNYSLFPLRVGQFTIPPLSFDIAQTTYSTKPITINVVDSSGLLTGAPGRTTQLKDKIFLKLRVSEDEAYLNQWVPVKVFLYASGLTVTDIQYPQLENLGFKFGEYGRPKPYQQVIDGVRYDVIEFDTGVYPTRSGTLTLAPAALDGNIIVKGSARRGGSNLFDDEFFNRFFSRNEKRPVQIKTKEITITVLELPEEKKPEGFSGAVGDFQFDVTISPRDVTQGDPLTLRMSVSGQGNLDPVKFPSLKESNDIKLYDPSIREEGGVKKFEQVVIPRRETVKEIPALSFHYFNPEINQYRTITKGPFAISVSKSAEDGGLRIIGPDDYAPFIEPETLGEDIVFIKDTPGTIHAVGQRMYSQWSFYAAILSVFSLLILFYLLFQRTHRLETDIVYARKLKAPKHAKKGLSEAQKLISSTQREEFYDTVFKTLQNYLANKLHLPAGSIDKSSIGYHLTGRVKERDVIDKIVLTLQECDAIRYSPTQGNEEEMRGTYERLENIIDYLERNIK